MLQMLREKLLQLLELVQARGVGVGGRFQAHCTLSLPAQHHTPAPLYPLRPTRVLSHPTCFILSPAPFLQRDLPAPVSQDTSLLRIHAAKPLQGLALGQGPKRGELLRLFPSADPGIPHGCRAEGHIPRRS